LSLQTSITLCKIPWESYEMPENQVSLLPPANAKMTSLEPYRIRLYEGRFSKIS